MKEHYGFNHMETESIINRFGQDFYEKVLRVIHTYTDLWALSDFQFIPSFSANLVMKCHSTRYGSAVLKMGNPAYLTAEYYTLRQYHGRRFCQVFEADVENGVILEARVRPGRSLRGEGSLHTRLSIFSSLYQDLHIPPAHTGIYPAYNEWVRRITSYMSMREDCKELYLYMKKAEEICLSVAARYAQQMLLHGDFHHDNILLSDNEEYMIIDPKGVIGDPVFDVPRFILNEFEDEKTPELQAKIIEIISVLEKTLGIPNEILKQCLYIETAMGACWSVEDGSTPEEYAGLLNNVTFAETIMNTRS